MNDTSCLSSEAADAVCTGLGAAEPAPKTSRACVRLSLLSACKAAVAAMGYEGLRSAAPSCSGQAPMPGGAEPALAKAKPAAMLMAGSKGATAGKPDPTEARPAARRSGALRPTPHKLAGPAPAVLKPIVPMPVGSRCGEPAHAWPMPAKHKPAGPRPGRPSLTIPKLAGLMPAESNDISRPTPAILMPAALADTLEENWPSTASWAYGHLGPNRQWPVLKW
mmetsp:Transcript_30412/g.97247  ORF Transcript_30412/g.97247 Transcript_30412/m.97247 type:complete len:222 (-) Transcript_30412:538-1203(-)